MSGVHTCALPISETLTQKSGFELVRFFFLLSFAAAIPAIVSGGIAERAKFWPQVFAAAVIVGVIYPFSEGIVWNGNYGIQACTPNFWPHTTPSNSG